MLYPRDFGSTTAGSSNVTNIGVSYSALRINVYVYRAHAVPPWLSTDPDDCIFPNVNIQVEFGYKEKTKCRMPLMTGALGSTFIAARYWDSFAGGAALVGIPIVIGENVVGVNKDSVFEKGKLKSSPELDRRINAYLKYFNGYGAIIV